MRDFEKIKKLGKEIVDELEIKETVQSGVEKTKEFVSKTSNRVNTYVDAIKSVREQEYFEKQYPLCLKSLESLNGAKITIAVLDTNEVIFTTTVVSHLEDCHDFCSKIVYVIEKSLYPILMREIPTYIDLYGEKIFEMTTLEFVLDFDEKTAKNLNAIAKKIVLGNEDLVKLGYTNEKLDFSKNTIVKKFELTKNNVRKRVENSTIYIDVKDNDEIFSIKIDDYVTIDAINSLLNGTYKFVDILYVERDAILMTTKSCVVLKAN